MEAVHPRLCVNGLSSWNQSVAEDLELYDRLGIHTIGAALRKLDSDEDVERLVRSGLPVVDVITPGVAHLERAIAIAQRLRAPRIVFTTGPATRFTDWDEAAAEFAGWLADVDRGGVTLCLEHSHSLRADVNFVHTLRDALDLADRLDLAVCMEINACWAERDLYRTIATRSSRIGLVQVSDYAIGTASTPDRLVPGDGDIPLPRILEAVLDAGYNGPFEIEILGPRIEEEGYLSAIERSCAYVGGLLTSLGD